MVSPLDIMIKNGKNAPVEGLEIDHELEFGGFRDRQVGRLLALGILAGVDADFGAAAR